MTKNIRSAGYLEERVAALEGFYEAAMAYFSSCPFCVEDVIEPAIMEEVERTRPLSEADVQRKMQEHIKAYIASLPKPVDAQTRDYVLAYITAHQMTPVETGSSLHVWDEQYIIEGNRYSVWGSIGSTTVEGVDLIPNKG